MTIHKIIKPPHEGLRKKNQIIKTFDDALKQLVKDMFETMANGDGAGLAAPQINVNKQLCVVNLGLRAEEESKPYVLINPEIIESEGSETAEEGCLSLPGLAVPVERATCIKVRAQDETGKTTTLKADGWLARCIQHEMDHLNGILLIDYLSPLKKRFALKKLRKLAQETL